MTVVWFINPWKHIPTGEELYIPPYGGADSPISAIDRVGIHKHVEAGFAQYIEGPPLVREVPDPFGTERLGRQLSEVVMTVGFPQPGGLWQLTTYLPAEDVVGTWCLDHEVVATDLTTHFQCLTQFYPIHKAEGRRLVSVLPHIEREVWPPHNRLRSS